MDKSAPWTVIQGTLTISAISATATGISGILRGQEHYGFLAGASALNSGITAAAFFTLREYVVSPILVHTIPLEQYERRRRELGIGQSSPETESQHVASSSMNLSSMRSNKILDSAVSGAATGGLLRGWKSGPKAVLPGAITVGVIATLLQLGYNEIGVQRLKYISRQHTAEPEPRSVVVASTPATYQEAPETTLIEDPRSWKARILSLMGVRKMSEEEYLKRLKLQREHHLVRIKELEQKLEEERKANTE